MLLISKFQMLQVGQGKGNGDGMRALIQATGSSAISCSSPKHAVEMASGSPAILGN
jgi:hypothetical protein